MKPKYSVSARIGFVDNVEYKVIERATGKILSQGTKKNIVVDTGLERIAKLLNGTSTVVFSRIAIGTDSTPEQATDVGLGAIYDIKDAVIGYDADNKAYWEGTFSFSSAVVINEAGVFDSGGTMLDRVTIPSQNMSLGIDLYIKISVEAQRV